MVKKESDYGKKNTIRKRIQLENEKESNQETCENYKTRPNQAKKKNPISVKKNLFRVKRTQLGVKRIQLEKNPLRVKRIQLE